MKRFRMLFCFFVNLLICLLVVKAHAAPSDNLGRLFSRPNERNNLDYLRQNQKLKVVVQQDNPLPDPLSNTAPPELPDPITLQGYVKRSDGIKSTLWINNKAVQEGSTLESVQIGQLNQRGFSNKGASTEGVDIKIPANGRHVRLKAGQVYEPETNQIKELKMIAKEKKTDLKEAGLIDGGDEQAR